MAGGQRGWHPPPGKPALQSRGRTVPAGAEFRVRGLKETANERPSSTGFLMGEVPLYPGWCLPPGIPAPQPPGRTVPAGWGGGG